MEHPIDKLTFKDGRVFDFISRTTPTSGTELNYINYVFALTKPLTR